MTILLHGFWGQPADWNRVIQHLPLQANVQAPDLYREEPLTPQTSWEAWPKRFWQWVDHQSDGSDPVVLVGYSMGARLALNAILHSPNRVARALLISGQVVLPKDAEAERLAWEESFAARFRQEDWGSLETAWQDQAVFAGSPAVEHRHQEELREGLALSILGWSPRRHAFGWPEVRALSSRVDWAFGALDQKYTGVAKSLQELPVRGQITIHPNVGHRMIWEAAPVVADWIAKERK